MPEWRPASKPLWRAVLERTRTVPCRMATGGACTGRSTGGWCAQGPTASDAHDSDRRSPRASDEEALQVNPTDQQALAAFFNSLA